MEYCWWIDSDLKPLESALQRDRLRGYHVVQLDSIEHAVTAYRMGIRPDQIITDYSREQLEQALPQFWQDHPGTKIARISAFLV